VIALLPACLPGTGRGDGGAAGANHEPGAGHGRHTREAGRQHARVAADGAVLLVHGCVGLLLEFPQALMFIFAFLQCLTTRMACSRPCATFTALSAGRAWRSPSASASSSSRLTFRCCSCPTLSTGPSKRIIFIIKRKKKEGNCEMKKGGKIRILTIFSPSKTAQPTAI
jgi:hypothetical protein